MRRIISVEATGFKLICTFENGDIYEYDMSFIHSNKQEMTEVLREQDFFSKVYLELGHLAWPNGYDIHAETVIREGKQIEKKVA